MRWPRIIKNFTEKYEEKDLTNEVNFFIKIQNKLTSEEIFNSMPYLGYLYVGYKVCKRIGITYGDEDLTFDCSHIKCKVIKCTKNSLTVWHYSRHDGMLYYSEVTQQPNCRFVIIGNELQYETPTE